MIKDRHISLAHGNGGRYMRELIADVFARHLSRPGAQTGLDVTVDAAQIPLHGGGTPYMTTDGFIVQPLEFPGGDIGSLAVHGTVNDLAVAGALPLYLTLNAFIEEGLEVALLDRVVRSLAVAAEEAGVQVVAGDTKVLPRGEGGGLYFATTGVGLRPDGYALGMDQIRAGDQVLVSGPIGDHGVTVMLARQDFEISGDLRSDSANVTGLTTAALGFEGLRFMRDPTRGGLGGVACEIVTQTGLGLNLREIEIPVRDPVRMFCEMLGYDPLSLACEGRVIAVVSADQASDLLDVWRQRPDGRDAAIIGQVTDGANRVELETELGGVRLVEELEEDPLPRIC
jgi:hydrogenase expression/formation protein HypE